MMDTDEFDVAQLLIRRGADLELVTSNTGYHKQWVEEHTRRARREIWQLIDDVKAAGGWRSYVHRDRMRLLVLRALCSCARRAVTRSVERGSLLGEGLRARRAASTALASELCDCARALTALVSTSMRRLVSARRRCQSPL